MTLALIKGRLVARNIELKFNSWMEVVSQSSVKSSWREGRISSVASNQNEFSRGCKDYST